MTLMTLREARELREDAEWLEVCMKDDNISDAISILSSIRNRAHSLSVILRGERNE